MNFILNLDEKYNILNTLSESDKCVVLNARSKVNGEQAAIRVIYNAKAGVLKSLPKIRNPYLTKVLEVIEDESDVIVIEKFIEGITVRQFLDDGGRLSKTEVCSIFTQLCQALSAIHREGIVHRDIKPSNIIINNKNAILIDFDVARRHDPQQSEDTVYMGTRGYAAPEQYGFSQTDSRSDIYSLGVVIRELLDGCFNTIAYKRVIDKCTQFDPINRYQTVDEILADLWRLTSETPVIPPVSQRSSKHRSIKAVFKIIAIISSCFFLLIISYTLVSMFYLEQEKPVSSVTSSPAPADERTLETFKEAYTEEGIVLEEEGVPFFVLIGAKNGIIFYMDGHKVAIYEYESEKVMEDLKKGSVIFADWPTNGKFVLETSNKEAIAIFNDVER